jgi:hypothetical protein
MTAALSLVLRGNQIEGLTMKSNSAFSKNTCAINFITVGLGLTLPTYADVFVGNLGAPASSTDVYGVTCPLGTVTMRAAVDDNGGVDNVRLTAQVINPQGDATTVFTAVDNGLSATATLTGGGPGNYLVTISKSQPSGTVLLPENYLANMDCFNAAGAPFPGNQALLVQNQ